MSTDGEQPLVVLRFEGPTFEGHDLPANALRELALFQEMFVDVAADIWRARHPRHGRLPNGFAAAVEPRMSSLGSGSVEVRYASPFSAQSDRDTRVRAADAAFASEACDLVLDALHEGASGRIHPDLSSKTIGRLSKLGSSLNDNDSIVAQCGERAPVRLDRDARMAFRRAVTAAHAATVDAPAATIGDLVALIDRHFGDVPDEVWAASPPLELHDVQDTVERQS